MERTELSDRRFDVLLERLDRIGDELARMNKRLDNDDNFLRLTRELAALNESLQAIAYAALGQQAPHVRRRRAPATVRAQERDQPSRQMSSTPVVAWSFAFPSGSATRPSTTIGLFQWPPPRGERRDERAGRRPVDVEPAARRSYTHSRPPATTGLVPPVPLRHAMRRWPLLKRTPAVPPLSPANSHVDDDRATPRAQ